MGLFDDVKKLAAEHASQEEQLLEKAMQEGENLVEEKTDHKYDSQIQSGGHTLEGQIEKQLPNL